MSFQATSPKDFPRVTAVTPAETLKLPAKEKLVMQVAATPALEPNVLGSDLSDAARAEISKRVSNAIKTVMEFSPELGAYLKAPDVQVHVVSDIRRQYLALAAQLKLPAPSNALSAFTLSVKQPDGSTRSLMFIDRNVALDDVKALEIVNHEARHVYQDQKVIREGKPLSSTQERESYAYSETEKDLNRILKAWTEKGEPASKLKALQVSIGLQEAKAKENSAVK